MSGRLTAALLGLPAAAAVYCCALPAFLGAGDLVCFSPSAAAVWTGALVRVGHFDPALGALAVSLGAGLVLAMPVVARRLRHRRGVRAAAHGSARWATTKDLRHASLLGRRAEGVVLGTTLDRPRRRVVEHSDRHVLLVMPPGAGKTTGPVVSTLLTSRATAIVLDPKGELWDLTSGWRTAVGHRCIRYSPTQSRRPAWNPLDTIQRGSSDVQDAALLAHSLVAVSAERGGDTHWTLSARALMVGLALHLVYAEDEIATLGRMRDLLSSESDDLFAELATFVHDPRAEQGWRDSFGEPTPTHPEVDRCARRFLTTPSRERGSIISTLQSHLDLWADSLIEQATSTSDFDLREILAASAEPTTLYASIPYSDLARVAPLLRLLLAGVSRAITARPPEAAQRVEIILDEFASLGRLPIIEDLLAFLRGFGVRAMLVVQDLRQITRLYGRSESLTGTCQVQVAGATQQPETRDHLSRLTGTSTVRLDSRSVSGSALGRRRVTRSESLIQRPLLTPGEVGTLPDAELLLLARGVPPARIGRLRYFEDPALSRRASLDPPQTWTGEAGEPAPRTPPPPSPAPVPGPAPDDLDGDDSEIEGLTTDRQPHDDIDTTPPP